MNENILISLISLTIALISLITNFILQKETRKIKELERQNKKLQSNLQKSLNAIKSYQMIEEFNAIKLNMKVQSYRKFIRKECNVEFNTEFLTPSNINNLIENNIK